MMAMGSKWPETKNDYTAKVQRNLPYPPTKRASLITQYHETEIWSWEPETKNDCAGEVQQQSVPLTKSIKSHSQCLAMNMEEVKSPYEKSLRSND